MKSISEHGLGLRTATIEGVHANGKLWIRFDGDPRPREAAVLWMRHAPDWRQCIGLPVLVGLRGGDSDDPVVIGLECAPPPAALVGTTAARTESLLIENDRELVLQCGKAKIALRADGRIEILGGYVLSRSTGPNKIKGASVDIN